MPFNSTFKRPGNGLARSSFKRKSPMSKTAIAKAAGEPKEKPKARATLKSKPPKTSKIRQSARHETCTLRLFGVCKVEPGNVVWAHSNRGEHGKGGALKADDEWGAYACYWCHCQYDRQHSLPPGMTREYVEDRFTAGMNESRLKLQAKGLLK
jgi:hypothetical protein